MTEAEKKRRAGLRRRGMNSGPRKQLSSQMLNQKSKAERRRKESAADRKFGDRGTSGREHARALKLRAEEQRGTDRRLIDKYGRDAPKARSYMTPKNNPSVGVGGQNFEEMLSDKGRGPRDGSGKRFRVGGMTKKKPVKKNMGGMMKYNKGGKVRGYGMARGGKVCKMVSMKGS